MHENRFIGFLLDRVPQKHWNRLSLFITYLTPRTIGSPIRFSFSGLYLDEHDLRIASAELLREYFEFCYPASEIADPAGEYEIDKQYWPAASTFIIRRGPRGPIVGSIQFVRKTPRVRLPLEHADTVLDNLPVSMGKALTKHLPHGSFAEIYRCRRAGTLSGADSVAVVSMLFKAIYAKTIQTDTEFPVLTFGARDKRLYNLYTRKLQFMDTGILLTYGDYPARWRLLYASSRFWDQRFAALSKPHFYLMTFFRNNLRKQRLQVQSPEITEPVITEEDTVLFTSVAKRKPSTARNPAFEKISRNRLDRFSTRGECETRIESGVDTIQ